jgi:hypothetical protein
LTQRKTQTAHYWQKEFTPADQDIEAIYNQILEQNQPVNLEDIAIDLVKRHCNAEEVEARSELQEGRLYQPKGRYTPDEKLVFPALDFATGTVVSTRDGHHPEYGRFTVIAVDFNGSVREFVANFEHNHLLNLNDQNLANLQGLMSPDELYQNYKDSIYSEIKSVLDANDDFVTFHDLYFLLDLLPEFHEGLFNIADAAIDINNGPLSVDALIEQMGLVEEGQEITDVLRFSVSYRLLNDERFDDVGPVGQILWYLDRIAPPEAHQPPRRLETSVQTYNPSLIDKDLYALLAEIDDETTNPEDIKPLAPAADGVTIVLNYPHRRVGTLPLTPRTQPFFPIGYYNPVLFEFVDGRNGNTFPGWVVWEHKYVFGLEKWYQKNKLPVGAYITLKRAEKPMQVIIDYQAVRTQRDWVRMVGVSGNRLTFKMNPALLGCQYDELMIIGEADTSKIDAFWVKAEERNITIFDVLCDIFPELSKLNPQSTVHAKTLYSAANVIRRAGPGVIFQELVTHPCFIPMNHGYWTYNPNLKDRF